MEGMTSLLIRNTSWLPEGEERSMSHGCSMSTIRSVIAISSYTFSTPGLLTVS
jgi:hypothetical protein